MSVDTRAIPIKDVIELEAVVTLDNKVRWHGQTIYKGTCPFCGGDDRFAIFEDENCYRCGINNGNGCGEKGDVITFLQKHHKWSFGQAVVHLREQYGLVTDGTEYEYIRPERQIPKDTAPSLLWQQQGTKLVKEAHDFLLDDCETARRARNYLLKRGIPEATIKDWKLGYVETSRYELRSAWGVADETDSDGKVHTKLLIPRGWLIPWFIKEDVTSHYPALWRIDIRRHPKDIESAEQAKKPIGKYHRVKGSSDGLFNSSEIKEGLPLIVVESPLDAIVGTQETTVNDKSEFIWCATGSTGGARKPQWVDAMSVAYPVLIAFDNDQAGSEAFKYWRTQGMAAPWISDQPFRWLPWSKDINDMLIEKRSIMDWALDGLEHALSLDMLLHPEIPDSLEIQLDLEPRPDRAEIDNVDLAFADHVHTLPDIVPSPRLTPEERLCPFCAEAGRKASGVALVQQGKYHNQDVYKRLPERPFYYAWIPSERVWWCPSCFDIQRSLPVGKKAKASAA